MTYKCPHCGYSLNTGFSCMNCGYTRAFIPAPTSGGTEPEPCRIHEAKKLLERHGYKVTKEIWK